MRLKCSESESRPLADVTVARPAVPSGSLGGSSFFLWQILAYTFMRPCMLYAFCIAMCGQDFARLPRLLPPARLSTCSSAT